MDAYIRRSYSGEAPDATLSADMDDTTLSVTCDDLTGWPDGTGDEPFEVTFEPGTSSEEKCWGSARSGNSITLLARGMEGSAVAHAATTTTVRHGFSALDADEANYAVSQTVGLVTAEGDLLQGTSANTLEKISVGSAGKALVVSAGKWVAGLPTMAMSDITGLVTALAGKLATPSTAIAKGSLLAGTGANVADALAVGADNTVLTADSTADAGVSWQSPKSGLLGSADYATALSVAQGSVTALDTTNATVTFTAPASGNVLLRASVDISNGGSYASALILEWFTHGTTTQVGRTSHTQSVAAGDVSSASGAQKLTGLTPGTSYHLDLAARNPTAAGLQITALTIEVWAA